ncbi:MAG: hypothetical protein JW791_02990, partial [Nanoarchaeota archaeon]|nr:hypothetical protein [Nanoarchaeota archaeon]
MMEIILNIFAMFISFFSIINVFLSYAGILTSFNVLISIVASISLTLLILIKNFPPKIVINKKILLINFGLFLILLFTILPNLIFPYSCSDLYNHARSTRIYAKQEGFGDNFIISHSYPLIYYSVTSAFYKIYPNTYVINTIFPIILLTFSITTFYYIIK